MAQLANLAERRAELLCPVRLYQDLIAVLFRRATGPAWRGFVASNATARLSAGQPLLRGESVEWDSDSFRARWFAVCDVLTRHREAGELGRLAEAVRSGVIDPVKAVHLMIRDAPRTVPEYFECRGFEARLAASVLRFCAMPSLAALVSGFALDAPRLGWSKGFCLVCGSWPLLAESRGLEQFRWLRCGLCGAGWQVDRIFCPFCETRDHRLLHDLFVESEESKCRVSVCDGCRGFVRGISTLSPITTPGLLVAELETLHLELIAQEDGYQNVTSLSSSP